jgi:hypothetical protein
MERKDKTIFFVYRGERAESWFTDLKEAVEFAVVNGLMLKRIHLKADGSVHEMILYESNKSEGSSFFYDESSL